jgi:indolepyruvate ferredoxin oxidoreductase
VAGVGGTGVLTIGGILGMAAHLDGLSPMVLDMAGLAQKGGAVLSHIRIGPAGDPADRAAHRDGPGGPAARRRHGRSRSPETAAVLCDPERTVGVVKHPYDARVGLCPVPRLRLPHPRGRGNALGSHLAEPGHFHDFSAAGAAVAGDEIASNILMLGFAWQKGLVPLSREAIEGAIRLNKVAVDANLDAFAWGGSWPRTPSRLPQRAGGGR